MSQSGLNIDANPTVRQDIGFAIISLSVIVVAPVLFWMVVLEWALPALGFAYDLHARLAIAMAIGGLLLLVWAAIWNSGDRGVSDDDLPLPRPADKQAHDLAASRQLTA